MCGKERVTFGVALLLAVMDLAIELNSELSLQTAEVNHERSDRVLSPELVAIQASIT